MCIRDRCVAVKEKLIVANWSNVDEIFISPGGTTIYYLDRFSGYDLENSNTDDENPNKGKLYQISIVGQTIEQPKLYADDISIVAPVSYTHLAHTVYWTARFA